MLLDANILFLPVRTRFPLEAEVDRLRPGSLLGVPSTVLAELDRLAARGTPEAAAARALAARYPTVAATGRGDDAVLRTAVRLGAWVVTADRELRARLASHGIGVLAPRDRHRLQAHPASPQPGEGTEARPPDRR